MCCTLGEIRMAIMNVYKTEELYTDMQCLSFIKSHPSTYELRSHHPGCIIGLTNNVADAVFFM